MRADPKPSASKPDRLARAFSAPRPGGWGWRVRRRQHYPSAGRGGAIVVSGAAGTPPTTAPGATSRVTTLPAATSAPSPMVTPLRMVQPISEFRRPRRVKVGIRHHAVGRDHGVRADADMPGTRRYGRAADLDAFFQFNAGGGRKGAQAHRRIEGACRGPAHGRNKARSGSDANATARPAPDDDRPAGCDSLPQLHAEKRGLAPQRKGSAHL